MSKKVFVFFLLAVFLTGCTCTSPPASRLLGVTLRPQETSMWCWAASGQMAMEFLGHNVNQCTQANNRFGRNDCCNNPKPAACVLGGWPEFSRYDFDSIHTTDAALSWETIRSEIGCYGRPFAFSWHWDGGGGHMMEGVGYQTQAGVNFVEVHDPWPPNVGTSGNASILTYTAYDDGAGYSHWDDYYRIRYVGED